MFLRSGFLYRSLQHTFAVSLIVLLSISNAIPVRAQAYVGKPKLDVIIVIAQYRGDYLNRQRANFKDRGFKLFMHRGAWFTDCYYDYANTKTAPGHATIGTGAYSDGHGIESNEWWDSSRSDAKKVTSVEDERYQLVGVSASDHSSASSPLNLRASTLGDELRLATAGKAKVFGVSLKDRAAILPPGHAANGAFWIEPSSGRLITSTNYMDRLPEWAAQFNSCVRCAEAEREANAAGIN